MDKETCYRKLIQALLGSNFRFRESDLSEEDASKDRDKLGLVIRKGLNLMPLVSEVIGLKLPEGITDIHPFFDQEGIQQRLNKVREFAGAVCIKYLLSQPVIVAIVEADHLSHEEIVRLVNRFDEIIMEMLGFTGKMGGIKIGSFHLGGTRLSATGIILFVFFDHNSASNFIESTQAKCKIQHFWKKTWVLPWVVDVGNRNVIGHSGLPFLPGILSRDYLQKEVFQEPEIKSR
jgi:hypothetical protein